MNHFYLIIALISFILNVNAQQMHIHKNDHSIVSISLSDIDSITFCVSDTTFTDPRDGRVYKIVKIGTQVWMAENLNYRTSDSSWYMNNDSVTYHMYGRLYTWNKALEAVPPGWHLPTDNEWTILTNYVGGATVAGGKLKETGTTHWNSPNTGATNETGFFGLPGGYRNESGIFDHIRYAGFWWTSTAFDVVNAWSRNMYYDNAEVKRYNYNKIDGMSVRCVRD